MTLELQREANKGTPPFSMTNPDVGRSRRPPDKGGVGLFLTVHTDRSPNHGRATVAQTRVGVT